MLRKFKFKSWSFPGDRIQRFFFGRQQRQVVKLFLRCGK